MWDVETCTNPVAQKDYHCQASDWIDNASLQDYELGEEEDGFFFFDDFKDVHIFPGVFLGHSFEAWFAEFDADGVGVYRVDGGLDVFDALLREMGCADEIDGFVIEGDFCCSLR